MGMCKKCWIWVDVFPCISCISMLGVPFRSSQEGIGLVIARCALLLDGGSVGCKMTELLA